MNTKKLVLASAVASALAAAGSVHATIQGVPGESLLIPFAAADYGEPSDGPVNDSDVIHTAVIITTPALVGTDTVLGQYTMPNTLNDFDIYEAPDEMTVRWYAFDEKSKHIRDDTFTMSPNDVYLWSPLEERLREYIGYLVFADEVAKSGEFAATFAMTGAAFMLLESSCEALGDIDPDIALCNGGSSHSDQNLTLPVVPMSDGADPFCGAVRCAEEDGNAHLGITLKNNVVSFRNSIIAGSDRVGHVSPIIAGVRMQSLFGDVPQQLVYLQGLYSPFEGNWTHMFWFSENMDGRFAEVVAWDDEEDSNSCEPLPLDNELNGFVYSDDDEVVYDLIKGFYLATDNDGSTDFSDACLQAGGGVAKQGENCVSICGTRDLFGAAQTDGFYKFTQAAPGIGIMDYTLDAGPYRTSTGMFFQFMTDISWDTDDIECPPGQDGNGCEGDGDPGEPDSPAVGNDFDIYAGGYIPMTELGRTQ